MLCNFELIGHADGEDSCGYLSKLSANEKTWYNSIGYATGRQRNQLRRFAQSIDVPYARLPGGGFRIRDGPCAIPANETKRQPESWELSKVFRGFVENKKSSKSPPPLVLGDYRSPRFRLETRLICWDFNQMGPWEKINTRVACAHWVLNSIEAGSNTCHLAALNPRANSRIHWKSRLLSQVNDSWTQLARSWLRVSAKRDALLDILCLAQQQLPSTSVLIISRNKRLIRAIKFHLPKDTKIIVADFRSRDFCLRHKIPIPLLNFGHEFCLYRPADELISSIMEDPEDHKDEEKLRSTIRQKSRVSFIGGRRFFVRRREQQQQQKQKIKGDR